jgi:hypothetical protein
MNECDDTTIKERTQTQGSQVAKYRAEFCLEAESLFRVDDRRRKEKEGDEEEKAPRSLINSHPPPAAVRMGVRDGTGRQAPTPPGYRRPPRSHAVLPNASLRVNVQVCPDSPVLRPFLGLGCDSYTQITFWAGTKGTKLTSRPSSRPEFTVAPSCEQGRGGERRSISTVGCESSPPCEQAGWYCY